MASDNIGGRRRRRRRQSPAEAEGDVEDVAHLDQQFPEDNEVTVNKHKSRVNEFDDPNGKSRKERAATSEKREKTKTGFEGLDTCRTIKVHELRKATTWDFDLHGEEWIEKKVMVHFPQGDNTQHGGIRTCRKMILISDDDNRVRQCVDKIRGNTNRKHLDYVYTGMAQLFVAKAYKKSQRTNIHYDELITQSVAEAYGQQFNRSDKGIGKKVDDRFRVGILPVSVMRLVVDEHEMFYNIEPFLPGRYQKFNDNYEYIHPSTNFVQGPDCDLSPSRLKHVLVTQMYSLLAQAFSHFTYHVSQGKCIVVDIQGVGSYYTDPQIHTIDGNGFGSGNLGERGMNAFFRSHTCSWVCKLIGLPEAGTAEYTTTPKSSPAGKSKSGSEPFTNIVGSGLSNLTRISDKIILSLKKSILSSDLNTVTKSVCDKQTDRMDAENGPRNLSRPRTDFHLSEPESEVFQLSGPEGGQAPPKLLAAAGGEGRAASRHQGRQGVRRNRRRNRRARSRDRTKSRDRSGKKNRSRTTGKQEPGKENRKTGAGQSRREPIETKKENLPTEVYSGPEQTELPPEKAYEEGRRSDYGSVDSLDLEGYDNDGGVSPEPKYGRVSRESLAKRNNYAAMNRRLDLRNLATE